MNTVRLTTGQALMRFLDNQYVEFDGVESKFVKGIFTVFGHGIVVGFGEAMEAYQGDIRVYQGKNEQGMAHAAIGYAKQTNRRAIIACASSIGPGALNFATAAATATVNRIPLLLFCADSYASRQPDPVLQQLEHFGDYGVSSNDALKPLSKYWDRISRPEQLMTAMLHAFRVLADPAETGAVTICLPQDAEGEAYDYPVSFFEKRVHHITRRIPTEGELERAVSLIKSKKKPLLICGGGVLYSEAGETLRKFAETHGVPFTETQAGKGAINWNHPLNLGAVGVSGGIAGNRTAAEADLIIAVGTRLSDFTTSSKWQFRNPEVEILSINVCSFDAYKMNAKQIIADAKETLAALSAKLDGYTAYYGDELAALKQEWDAEVDRMLTDERPGALSQTRVLGEMQRAGRKDDVIVAASGSLPDDVRKYWRAESYKSYHCEYGFSCMGYEVNAALGVKLAEPQREVFALAGDAAFQMLHTEFVTAIQENKKITAVIFDNQGFGCIENLQNGQGIPTFCTKTNFRDESTGRLTGENVPINYAKLAEGYGAKGYNASNVEELRAALAAARKEPGCVIIDVKILPKSMGGHYENWWRVGTPEVSDNPKVMAARRETEKGINEARKY